MLGINNCHVLQMLDIGQAVLLDRLEVRGDPDLGVGGVVLYFIQRVVVTVAPC